MIKTFENTTAVILALAVSLSATAIPQSVAQEKTHQTPRVTNEIIDVSQLGASQWLVQTKHLANEVNSNGMPPADYVVSKFNKFDVVLFGEIHEVKENCEFVSSLIEPLHRAGVYLLFSEFIPSRFNAEIEEITTAVDYDREAVIKIFRQRPSPVWGYLEYMDIVESVWRFNQSLDDNQPKFKLIGIEDDWNEAKMFQADAAERFKIVVHREEHMTKTIREMALEKQQKCVVHIGYAHTVKHGIRVAAELEKSHAGRVFQVVTHHEFSGSRNAGAMSKCLEDVVKQSKFTSVGFDIEDSSFAMLRDEKSFAFKMMGEKSTFQDLARGYVFLKPLDQLKTVTWVDGFIVEDTFKDALEIAKRKQWIKNTPESASELDQLIAEHFRIRNKKPKQN